MMLFNMVEKSAVNMTIPCLHASILRSDAFVFRQSKTRVLGEALSPTIMEAENYCIPQNKGKLIYTNIGVTQKLGFHDIWEEGYTPIENFQTAFQ